MSEIESKVRTMEDVRATWGTYNSNLCQRNTAEFYDSYAATYDYDHTLMEFSAPKIAVDLLMEHFSGNRGAAEVLDVACGSGWVARMLSELGFKNFVGTDGSKGMLDLGKKSGLYKQLHLALLGPEPLPSEKDIYDVVIIVGALDANCVPVRVVRELCNAAKPGGFICMAKGHHKGPEAEAYRQDLERELRLMEEEKLWTRMGVNTTERYMDNPHPDTDSEDQEKKFIKGTAYLFKKNV